MTSPYPGAYPGAPAGPPGVAPGFPPPQYVVRPPRPPLTRALKRSAAAAGILGFTLLNLGWSIAALALGIGLFAGFFALIFGLIASSTSSSGGFSPSEILGDVDLAPWVGLLVVATIVGAVLWAAGLLVSRAILGRAGHPHPWGVTWAGFGIAVVASWIAGAAGSVVWSIAAPLLGGLGTGSGGLYDGDAPGAIADWLGGYALVLVGTLLVSAAVAAVIGWLSWWWMAHAMRPAAAPQPPHRY